MPANGRRDLIRCLKFNVNCNCMWCTSFSQTKLSQPKNGAATVMSLSIFRKQRLVRGAATVMSLSIFRKQRLVRVTVTYLVENILLCTKSRTAGTGVLISP